MKVFNLKKHIKKGLAISNISVRFDWVAFLLALTFVFIIMIFFSWGIYSSVLKDSRVSSEEESVVVTQKINTEQLDRVMDNFNKRKEKFDSLTGGMVFSRSGTSTEEQF